MVVAAYNRLDGADDAAKKLKDAIRSGGDATKLSLHNVATIKVPEDGKVKITEQGKIRKMHGAGVGALLGGASVMFFGAPMAVVGGTVGGALAGVLSAGGVAGAEAGAFAGAGMALRGSLVAHFVSQVAGAATGAYAAAKTETLNPTSLNRLGSILKPNNSAIIAVFDQVVIPMAALDAEKREKRDEVLGKVSNVITDALAKGDDAAVMIVFTDDAVMTRTANGDDALELRKLAIEGVGVESGSDDEEVKEETVTYELSDGEGDEVVVNEEGAEKLK